jgi:hypothetical protein
LSNGKILSNRINNKRIKEQTIAKQLLNTPAGNPHLKKALEKK